MKRQLWLGILGIVTLLIGCSGESGDKQAQPRAMQTPTPTAQTFSTPLINSSAKPIARPVPGLLQPTNAATRIPSIVTGRRDPFAIVLGSQPPIIISSNSSKVALAPLPRNVNKLPAQPIPSPGIVPSLSLPPIAVGASPNSLPNLSPMPPGSLPTATIKVAPPSRTSVADAIAVNGIVQVGGRWTVIVKEPSAVSSRYVAVGDYLENGKVLVKKIVAVGSADPVVVLQQNGVEIRKSLG